MFLLMLCTILLLLPMAYGCEMPSINLTFSNPPADDVNIFFDQLSKGNYAVAEDYIFNYSSAGFESKSDDPINQKIFELLKKSRSVEIVEQGEVYGKSSTVTIRLTTLDFRKLKASLTDKTLEEIKAREFRGESFDTEEAIITVTCEILDKMTPSISEYYSTNEFEVNMRLSDGKWKIVCTEELYSALIGYAI